MVVGILMMLFYMTKFKFIGGGELNWIGGLGFHQKVLEP